MKYLKLVLTNILFTILYLNVFSQNAEIDSLKKVIASGAHDTIKIQALSDLCYMYSNIDAKAAIDYGKQGLALSKKIDFLKGQGNTSSDLGTAFVSLGEYDSALVYHKLALEIREKINDPQMIANSLSNVGRIYYLIANYEEGLTYHLKSLKIREELKDYRGIAIASNNIGLIYQVQKNYYMANFYFNQALTNYKKVDNTNGIAATYYNFGNLYMIKGTNERQLLEKKKQTETGNKNIELSQKELFSIKALDTSLMYLEEAKNIYTDLGNARSLANTVELIGAIYGERREFSKAIQNINKSMNIRKEMNDVPGIVLSLFNIASFNNYQKNFKEAVTNLHEALTLAAKINDKSLEKDIYKQLASNYEKLGNFKNAFVYQEKYSILNDSLISTSSIKQMAEMNAKYDNEKKESQIKLLTKDQEVKDAKLKQNRIVIFSFLGGVLLLLALSFVILQGYRQKQKANLLLENKNKEIEAKNEVIEKKNKDITASIRYAFRIQSALLPTEEMIHKYLPNCFVLYRPKDIVSGDFYYFCEKDNFIIFAAVDCTGHGVPGAFMSIVGHNLITQAINEKQLSKPSDILNFLSLGVNKLLRKDNDEQQGVKDGMDLTFCTLDKTTGKLQMSGAYNPLMIVRNKEVIQFDVDIYPIGTAFNEKFTSFTNVDVDVQPGDTIYLFSDGYLDQFGGPNKKKFMKKQFRETLIKINDYSLAEQKDFLYKRFDEWKGEVEQIDDVLVIGVKI